MRISKIFLIPTLIPIIIPTLIIIPHPRSKDPAKTLFYHYVYVC